MNPKYTLGERLFSVFMWTAIGLVTIGVSTSIMILSYLLPFLDPRQHLCHRIANLWGKILFAVNPNWHLTVKGGEQIRDNESYVLAANHNSMSDIICLYCLEKRFKWIAKEVLFKIPFFGWAMTALRYISVRRGDRGSGHGAYQKSLTWLKENMSVLYFPEGTRSETGALGPFKSGAFRVAIESKRPIVPIVLRGTRDLVPKKGFVFSGEANCSIKVLAPISTSSFTQDQYRDLEQLVRTRMLEELGQVGSLPS